MSARDEILGRIRGALADHRVNRPAPTPYAGTGVAADERVGLGLNGADSDALTERFIVKATQVSATSVRVDTLDDVPAAVTAYLGEGAFVQSPLLIAAALASLPWPEHAAEQAADPRADGMTSVTPCFAAIAETGSVVLLSSPKTPTSLNFVVAQHIVVVKRSAVAATMEQVWSRLRASGQPMPRTINVVTGPSRTADVEQVVQVGVHGPQRMHLIVCNDA
jgi:L-lactate dehydrogenase complex protein LldG